MVRPKCSFCGKPLNAQSPVNGCPSFRCEVCNVRVVVTNQSSMEKKLRSFYWRIVRKQGLMKQKWLEAETEK